ncbi:MAG: hypothetical protein DSY81_07220 [Bacillota bacterium]|nr:MAG: hypothetical protein DSY81_07220 [Bacillota bacterium]
MSNWRQISLVLAMTMLMSSFAFSQVHTVTASNETVLPGASVTAIVTLDNDEGARGFSMGLAHPGTFLTLTAIDAGTATANANAGAGPDFEFKDLAAAGGPGGTYGVILSFGSPLDEIPVGANNAIADFTYSCNPAAVPGTSEVLNFSDSLGSPVVTTIISVVVGSNSISRIPTKVSGSVSVATPAPSGLSCVITDPCAQVGNLTWVNGDTYDSVEVYANGVLIDTAVGSPTTYFHIVGAPVGVVSYDVLGIRNGTSSALSNVCALDYQTVPTIGAPFGFVCSVDQPTGDTTVNWDPGWAASASSIEVSLDGLLVATLSGGISSIIITIGGPGSYSITVIGSNQCGVFDSVGGCTVTRDNFFIRNDMNQDGTENIADPVQGLNYLFGGGTMDCLDAADVNDDGAVDLGDIVYGLNVIFGIPIGGSVPTVPAPAGACGPDPTADAVGCISFTGC